MGPRMREEKKKKGGGRMQAARSFKTYQDISGGMNIAIIQSFKGVPFQTGHQPDGTGKLAGVSRQTISLIERGDYSPSVTLALKLARYAR